MKKRKLHQNLHPFDPFPFEIFSHGSWKPVLYLQVHAGSISTLVVDEGDVIEENVQISSLRIKSRKATFLDCICFLRPGLDVCVLSTSQEAEISCENENLKPVWLDAKVKTIERKHHETGCDCQFYVSFYSAQKENVSAVKINQISILQKLDRTPIVNMFFRWECSQDCTSLLQSQLYPGKFASDLSWTVVASLHKEINFNIRLMQKKIVYQISEYYCNEIYMNSRDQAVALNFRVENGISVPVVFAFNLTDKTGKGINSCGEETEYSSIYHLLGLRRSKRRNVEPDRYLDCSGLRIYKTQNGKDNKYQFDFEEFFNNDLERQSENDGSGAHSYGKSSLENFKEIRNKTKSMEKPTLLNRIVQAQKVPLSHKSDKFTLNDLEDIRNNSESEDTVSENISESQNRTILKKKSIKFNQLPVQPNLESEINYQSRPEETASSSIHKIHRAQFHVDGLYEVDITNAESGSRSNVRNTKSGWKSKYQSRPEETSSSSIHKIHRAQSPVDGLSEVDITNAESGSISNVRNAKSGWKSKYQFRPEETSSNSIQKINRAQFPVDGLSEVDITKAETGSRSNVRNAKSGWKSEYQSCPEETSFILKSHRAQFPIDGMSEVDITNAESGSRSNVRSANSGWKSKYSYKHFQTRWFSSINSQQGNFHGISGCTSLRTSIFKKMMEKCVENIESTIGKEQPLAIDQWIEIKAKNSLIRYDDSDSSQSDDEENSELDLLWNEMDLCIASTYLLDANEVSVADVPQSKNNESARVCEHEFKLDEEIGILCQSCGHVETEIKNILPNFFERSRWKYSKSEFCEGTFEPDQGEHSESNIFTLSTVSNIPLSESEDNVWALIPDLRTKLHFHQKKAFEFLWRNIAGTFIPAQMHTMAKKKGGCVISHSPGAGKTLLIIAFLESYLKLFPGSRPLVLAPNTTLYAWYKEFKKWNISIPVYRIHSGKKSREAPLRVHQNSFSRDYTHILDCLEKIQKWVSNPSVLIMGYPSFSTLIRGHTNCSYKQYMARILKKNPGILILDEGHNPRATKSGLRKALMRVETKLRVLLSGTLFQNNFGEYFNTLALARPSFVDEVLAELDPSFKRSERKTGPRFSLENRARRIFNNRIANKINVDLSDERLSGLHLLRKLTNGFIDVYEGGSENLPGLHCYTLMMKSTTLQQELLVKLQNQKPSHRGFPLELGTLITLGSIHPWLIQTAPYATQHFTSKELNNLEKCKYGFKLGPKVRFVMSLMPRCIIKNEKVLIFCFNIAPIKFFVEIFESVFGWKKGDDVLVITGDLELFERGRILDKFEEKGSNSKVMLASISACGEGVSLTAASRIILLDSQWNPSKTKQAIARAFRPGQQKVVYVYQLLASGTLEEDKYVKTTWKEWMSSLIFSDEIAENPSQMKADKIEDDVLREIVEDDGSSLFHMIIKNNEKASMSATKG